MNLRCGVSERVFPGLRLFDVLSGRHWLSNFEFPSQRLWGLGSQEAEQQGFCRVHPGRVGQVKAVFDSDVLIDFLQGDPRAATKIDQYEEARYSVTAWNEVMCGAETDEEGSAVKVLFESMKSVDLSSKIARATVQARTKYRLKLLDAVICATAHCEGCLLVTRNTRDFDKDHPMIRDPY